MNVRSDWFIAARVRRLIAVIDAIPSGAPGIDRDDCLDAIRAIAGGPRAEHPQLIDVLRNTGLIFDEENRYRRTSEGERLMSMNAANARTHIASILIQRGLLYDQVRQLIEAATVRPDGSAFVRVSQIRSSAPQLLGVLAAWAGVVGPSLVEIPNDVYALMDTPWSLIPLPRVDDGRAKAVGSRAEAYSYHFLRLGGASSPSLTWVALDDDRLGYDIEDRSKGGFRCVEVKGSEQPTVRFFLTENEHRVAHTHRADYSVHFWGEINLNRNPNDEYQLLRRRGFPVVFDDLARHLTEGLLEATVTKYRVTPGPNYGQIKALV